MGSVLTCYFGQSDCASTTAPVLTSTSTPNSYAMRTSTVRSLQYYALRAGAAQKDFPNLFWEPPPERTKKQNKNRRWRPCFLYFLTAHPSFCLLSLTLHIPHPRQTSCCAQKSEKYLWITFTASKVRFILLPYICLPYRPRLLLNTGCP
jgi:hypothetical protein